MNPDHSAVRWAWDFGVGLGAEASARLMTTLRLLASYQALGPVAAAQGVSYRGLWGLLTQAEAAFGRPLVSKGRGRGTRLTAFAEALLALDDEARATLAAQHAPWAARLQELLTPRAVAPPERLHIAASHDLALADWVENGRHVRVDLYWRGSEEAMLALARGECDVAGFHLPLGLGRAEAAAWVGGYLGLARHRFFEVMRREHGILVPPGNPLAIHGVADIARPGVRMVNRQRGSGTRSMIDQLLAASRLDGRAIAGYAHEEFTHDAVAAAVASGQADAGFAIRAAASRYDLDFVPLGSDRYCLAIRTPLAGTAAVSQLLRRLQGDTFRRRLAAMPGYTHSAQARGFLGWRGFAAGLAAGG